MEFLSQEWFFSGIERLKCDEEFREKANGFEGHVQVKVLKDRKAGLNKDVGFGMWLPTCGQSWYETKLIDDVDLFIEGKASTFINLFTGRMSPVMALTSGSLRLNKGSIGKLTRNLCAVNRFLTLLAPEGIQNRGSPGGLRRKSISRSYRETMSGGENIGNYNESSRITGEMV